MTFSTQSKWGLKAMLLASYLSLIAISGFLDFEPGKQIGQNFLSFAMTMLKILPATFILIGLFDVWVSSHTVEKHLGQDAGFKGHLWAILLAGMVVGPLYVALPIAHSFQKKGASMGVVFTYLGASAVCRIPMAIFEASILGVKFTAIRFMVSLPLVIITSILFEPYLNSITIMKQNDSK